MKTRLTFLLLSLLAFKINAQIELPSHSPKDQIIRHEGYPLKYYEEHEQADWVAYELTKHEVLGKEEMTGDFREDPGVKTGSAALAAKGVSETAQATAANAEPARQHASEPGKIQPMNFFRMMQYGIAVLCVIMVVRTVVQVVGLRKKRKRK